MLEAVLTYIGKRKSERRIFLSHEMRQVIKHGKPNLKRPHWVLAVILKREEHGATVHKKGGVRETQAHPAALLKLSEMSTRQIRIVAPERDERKEVQPVVEASED